MNGMDRALDWLVVEMMEVLLLFRLCVVAVGELKKPKNTEGLRNHLREMRQLLLYSTYSWQAPSYRAVSARTLIRPHFASYPHQRKEVGLRVAGRQNTSRRQNRVWDSLCARA